ncbi:hypothetical protein, partial [Mycobacterium sp.]|uniref:hypothetical protein n=1 Tax=Mycobacterium sp. TaxID=1785 RepID=UPI002B61146F
MHVQTAYHRHQWDLLKLPAIYARVSSARQKEQETIRSQTAAVRAHAEQLGLDVPEQWVFEDDG